MNTLFIPNSRAENITDSICDFEIKDPFRWLEKGEDSSVKRWVNSQNKYTQAVLRRFSKRTLIKKELLKYLTIDYFGTPAPFKEHYFWDERRGSQNQPVLCVKKGLKGTKRVLIDPNKLSKKGIITLSYWYPSPNGKYVAYGLSEGGTEEATLYILETETGKKSKEKIPFARYSTVRWLSDESGFFYTRYPKPGTVKKGEELYHERVYFHKLGKDPNRDLLIFGKDLPKEDMLYIGISEDDKYLVISVYHNWSETTVYLYEINSKKVTNITGELKAIFVPFLHRGRIYLLTNDEAPNYKIIASELTDIPKRLSNWKTIIKEQKAIIEDYFFVRDRLIVKFLNNVVSELNVYDLDGWQKDFVKLPDLGSVSSISGDRDGNEFFFHFQSFVIPETTYRYDLDEQKLELYQKPKLPFNEKDYKVEQKWFKSKDETKVPVFVFHKKKGVKKNKKNPTVLYGYGGFAVNETPSFYNDWMPFLDKGGVVAVANIRGGGEFGEKWHKDGILDNKQNSFDDFIAAAEFLVKEKYTKPEELSILGGSNGGLLVSAVMVQRPDLFKAVISMVPLTDMVRFPKYLMAARWIAEYGNPEDKKDLKKILQWSPYHNVRDVVEYPAVLTTTGVGDTRVDPLHARKMTALLQSVNNENPVLLRTELNAGHGQGKPLNMIVSEQVDILAFLYWQLGIK